MNQRDQQLKGDEKELFNITIGLEEAAELGILERVERDDGNIAYKATKKGKAYTAAMPFESEEESEAWLKGFDAATKNSPV